MAFETRISIVEEACQSLLDIDEEGEERDGNKNGPPLHRRRKLLEFDFLLEIH